MRRKSIQPKGRDKIQKRDTLKTNKKSKWTESLGRYHRPPDITHCKNQKQLKIE